MFSLLVSTASNVFSLSFNSKIILWAVFTPIPGSDFIFATSSVITANAKVDGSIFDKILIADFAPIPLTVIKSSNIFNSSFVKNPYKLILSSFT